MMKRDKTVKRKAFIDSRDAALGPVLEGLLVGVVALGLGIEKLKTNEVGVTYAVFTTSEDGKRTKQGEVSVVLLDYIDGIASAKFQVSDNVKNEDLISLVNSLNG